MTEETTTRVEEMMRADMCLTIDNIITTVGIYMTWPIVPCMGAFSIECAAYDGHSQAIDPEAQNQ